MTDLIVVENVNAVEVFSKKGGLDPLIKGIKEKVETEVFDITTEEGRKRMNRVSLDVGGAVRKLEKMALGLTEESRNFVGLVNAEKKRMKEELYDVRDIVKAPLDAFNEKEEQRKENHKANIELLKTLKNCNPNQSSDFIKGELNKLNDLYNSVDDWQEFKDSAEGAYHVSMSFLNGAISTQEKLEKEAVEAEKVRIEQEAIATKEREDRIAKDAADKAKREAEEKAANDKIIADQKAKDARDKIEADKIAAEKREQDAIQAKIDADKKAVNDALIAKQAETAAIDRAEKRRIDDLNHAEMEKEAAIIAEREKIAREKQLEIDAQKAREADIENKRKVHNDIKDMLMAIGLDVSQAKNIISAMAQSKVPHVKINY